MGYLRQASCLGLLGFYLGRRRGLAVLISDTSVDKVLLCSGLQSYSVASNKPVNNVTATTSKANLRISCLQ
jgi:hypothetical protein